MLSLWKVSVPRIAESSFGGGFMVSQTHLITGSAPFNVPEQRFLFGARTIGNSTSRFSGGWKADTFL